MQTVQKQESKFLTAADVSQILGIAESTAYRIIKKLNDDLKRKGFITVAGRISKVYFQEKTYF